MCPVALHLDFCFTYSLFLVNLGPSSMLGTVGPGPLVPLKGPKMVLISFKIEEKI